MAATTRQDTGTAAARSPGCARSAAPRAICSGCGRVGADRATVADLGITWLLPNPTDPGGPARMARFCRECAPSGPLGEITCAGCGDGPILTGALAEPIDLATAAVVETWLTETGWHWRIVHAAGPWCPDCARVVASRTGNRG